MPTIDSNEIPQTPWVGYTYPQSSIRALPSSVEAAARVSRAMQESEASDRGSAIDHDAWLERVMAVRDLVRDEGLDVLAVPESDQVFIFDPSKTRLELHSNRTGGGNPAYYVVEQSIFVSEPEEESDHIFTD